MTKILKLVFIVSKATIIYGKALSLVRTQATTEESKGACTELHSN